MAEVLHAEDEEDENERAEVVDERAGQEQRDGPKAAPGASLAALPTRSTVRSASAPVPSAKRLQLAARLLGRSCSEVGPQRPGEPALGGALLAPSA
jgi:hypothetical protein